MILRRILTSNVWQILLRVHGIQDLNFGPDTDFPHSGVLGVCSIRTGR